MDESFVLDITSGQNFIAIGLTSDRNIRLLKDRLSIKNVKV